MIPIKYYSQTTLWVLLLLFVINIGIFIYLIKTEKLNIETISLGLADIFASNVIAFKLATLIEATMWDISGDGLALGAKNLLRAGDLNSFFERYLLFVIILVCQIIFWSINLKALYTFTKTMLTKVVVTLFIIPAIIFLGYYDNIAFEFINWTRGILELIFCKYAVVNATNVAKCGIDYLGISILASLITPIVATLYLANKNKLKYYNDSK